MLQFRLSKTHACIISVDMVQTRGKENLWIVPFKWYQEKGQTIYAEVIVISKPFSIELYWFSWSSFYQGQHFCFHCHLVTFAIPSFWTFVSLFHDSVGKLGKTKVFDIKDFSLLNEVEEARQWATKKIEFFQNQS